MLLIRRLARVVLPVALIAALAGGSRAEIAVVVDGAGAEPDALVAATRRGAGAEPVRVYDLRHLPREDPIRRGQFLARIAAADLVVPLGSVAAAFIAEELDEVRTFFVGGGLLPGAYLRLPNIAGILPYQPDEVVRVIKGLRPGIRTLGLITTRGYEPVVGEVRAAAARAELQVVEAPVTTRKEVGPAIRSLTAATDVLWLLGDPLVGAGAGLQMVVETALARRIPVVGTTRSQVEAGVLFCLAPDSAALGQAADRTLREIVSVGFELPERRIILAPPGGAILYHGPLAERLGVSFRPGLRRERIR